MNKFLSIILLIGIVSPHQLAYCDRSTLSENNIAYVTDLSLAQTLSAQTHQDILLIFSASWCRYCQVLKKDLIKLDNIDNKIICIIDIEEQKELVRKFKIKTIPSSFIINSDIDILSSKIGYDHNSYNAWLAK